jgi:hypothetical protein
VLLHLVLRRVRQHFCTSCKSSRAHGVRVGCSQAYNAHVLSWIRSAMLVVLTHSPYYQRVGRASCISRRTSSWKAWPSPRTIRRTSANCTPTRRRFWRSATPASSARPSCSTTTAKKYCFAPSYESDPRQQDRTCLYCTICTYHPHGQCTIGVYISSTAPAFASVQCNSCGTQIDSQSSARYQNNHT